MDPTADAVAARRRAVALLVFLTLVWGTNWPLFPLVVREISVWTFRAVSMPLAAGLLFALAALRGERLLPPRRVWPRLVAIALGYIAVWNVATTFAAIYIPSGHAAVLGYTMPLWAALFGFAALGQRLTLRILAALAAGAAAVALLTVEDLRAFADAPAGLALGLAAGAGWAAATLVQKRTDWGAGPLALTAWQLGLGWLPIVAVAAVLGDWRWPDPSATTVGLTLYIALVPMALGFATWNAIVRLLPAQVAALSTAMVPQVAMLGGWAIGAEPFGPVQALAMVCAGTAVWLALAPARR